MKNLMRLFILFLLTGLSIGFYACSESDDCSISGRAMVYCNFYTLRNGSMVVKDTLDSLTVTALGTDSIIVNNQKKVSNLMLPLQYTSDSTVLILHYAYRLDPTLSDTLYIQQENTSYFESMDCGYSIKQKIKGVKFTTSRLDSIYVQNKEANINGTENLKLFYRN